MTTTSISPSAKFSSVGESGKRSGNASCSVWSTWFATRGPTIASSADGGIGSPSRSAASSVSSNVLPFSSACMSTVDWRVSRRLTTNAGASRTRTPRLPSFFVTSQAVASVTSSVGRCADELDEREHRDRIEEVHPDDALRDVRGRAAISATDSDDVFVTSRHSSETTLSSAPKTSCLTAISSNTASITRSQPANADVSGDAGRRSSRGSAPCLRASRPRATCFSRSARIAATASSTRAGVDVGDHERHLEPAQEQRRELRRHQAGADDADLLDPPRLRVGNPDALLDAPLDEVERVDAGLRLRAGEQVGERVLLGGVALLDRPAGGAGDQLERAVRGERDAVHRVVDGVARLRADLGRVGEVGGRARRPCLLDRADEPLDRVVEELDVVEQRVDEPELGGLRGRAGACSASGGSRRSARRRAAAPTSARRELGPAPGGDDPEEDLGEADVAHRAGERCGSRSGARSRDRRRGRRR